LTQHQFDLSGRVAFVTGASSGIGRRLALALAKAGAKVAVTARRTERLVRLVDEIMAVGGSAAAIGVDVESEQSIVDAFSETEARLGTVDTIYANAGMNVTGGTLDLAMDAFDQLMRVNVRGVYLTAREGARRMIETGSAASGSGRIILMGSIGGHTVLPGLTAYCASKAAVAMMGRSMARDWARSGINVNVVCPGYVETELNDAWFASDVGRKQVQRFPRGRLMQEEDLLGTLLLLGSGTSRAITGGVFTVDDGQSL